MNKPATLNKLLVDKNSLLGKLYMHTIFLGELEKSLGFFLGPPLSMHCTVANYASDTLVLHSDSAAWAAKLRYNTPAILEHMRLECNLCSLKTIRIKVKPPGNCVQSDPVRRLTISRTAADSLIQAASVMPDDDLRSSLLRFVKHNRDPV